VPQRPDLPTIREAHDRIRPHIHRTPVMTCATLDRLVGARLYFKCENLQKAGAFKSRGAANAVFSLGHQEASRGVVTHSSGNHAAALARAATARGIPAYIVMPSNSAGVKVAAVEGYGGRITFCEPTQDAREAAAAKLLAEAAATMIHPYDDDRIIAGQGTAVVELLEDVPHLDAVIAPVGGGGLLSGTLIAAKALKPDIRVLAGEPHKADDAYRSLQAGHRLPADRFDTIADGLRTSLGDKTFPIISEMVDGILLASEDGIVAAMRLIMERMKLVVETSAAVPLAALLENEHDLAGRAVGVILSGGNVDLAQLPFTSRESEVGTR